MSDTFSDKPIQIDSPVVDGEAVDIGSGDHTFTQTTRAIWVGEGGDVSVDLAGGTTALVLKGVQTGTLIPVRASEINQTGTTAANIVGLW